MTDESDYLVDPSRLNEPETGIFIRARLGTQWGSHDLATLDRDSVVRWLTSRDNPAEAARLALLLGIADYPSPRRVIPLSGDDWRTVDRVMRAPLSDPDDVAIVTQPTPDESAALATFPAPRGGDAEDHALGLVDHLRGHGISASPKLRRERSMGVSGHHTVTVLLPSGAVISPGQALVRRMTVMSLLIDATQTRGTFTVPGPAFLLNRMTAQVRGHGCEWEDLPGDVQDSAAAVLIVSLDDFAMGTFSLADLLQTHEELSEDDDGNPIMVEVRGSSFLMPVQLDPGEHTIGLSGPAPWAFDIALVGIV